jgi:host factor-I protein
MNDACCFGDTISLRAEDESGVRAWPPTGIEELKMEKLAQNIQEAFLNNARKDKIFLTIYLMSGVKLSGRIKSFDKYSVVLESNNQEQLIFKHAISTVVVSRPMHGHPAAHTAAAGVPGPGGLAQHAGAAAAAAGAAESPEA